MDVSHEQHDLSVDQLHYPLPEGRIATRPSEPRDAARMMVVRRSTLTVDHRHVRDLPDYLTPDDLLVFNNSAVAPARLVGRRSTSGGAVEGLFLHELPPSAGGIRWLVMLKAGGRLRQGDRIDLLDHRDQPAGTSIELSKPSDGCWEVQVSGAVATASALDGVGRTPLPPYILKAREGGQPVADQNDRSWYQTVYADLRQRHSVAAPTAGLHFTPELLNRLAKKGVGRAEIVLHVGVGTFKPITARTVREHRMHAESFEVGGASAQTISHARLRPEARIIAVGTTTVRVLETLALREGQLCGENRGLTDLLIAPPHQFRLVDDMLTNFHLPRSTLLALVAAMVGLERLKTLYADAIDRGYRFYSYGDAMLILP